jgi:hypothetical protein
MTVLNIGSKRAEKAATKLAQEISELCTGQDLTVVACALMGVVSSLPVHLRAHVCATVAANTAQESPHGNDNAKGLRRQAQDLDVGNREE